MYLSRSVHVPTIPTRPGRPKAGPGPSDDNGDDDDDDDDDDNPMILNYRAKNYTSERTIVPWMVIFGAIKIIGDISLYMDCP